MSVDFGSIGAQAKEMISAAATSATTAESAPAAQPAAPAVDAGNVQQTPASVAQPLTQQPSAQTPLPSGQVAAEPTFQVDLGNGRVETLTQSQLKDAYLNGLRQSDYTKKTQEAATLRQQAQQVIDYFNKPENVLRAAQGYLAQQQPPPPPLDPNAPVTVGQLQQFAQAINQQHQVLGQQAQQLVEDRLAVANYAENINGELNKIYQKHPVLTTIPEFEDVLRYRVAQTQPESLEQAVQTFNTIAEDMGKKLASQFTQQQQAQAVQKAQFVQSGTPAPGGVAPAQQPVKYTDERGRPDWNRLKDAAKSMQFS